MADAKSKEQLGREWWDAWWAADYSWDGLAKRDWTGWVVDNADQSLHEADSPHAKEAGEARLRPATLQDYWRDQEVHLITSPDGAHQFTRVHLPLHWRDGPPTGKADWPDDALDANLAPKLIAGVETTVDLFGDVTGVDRRAQLQGAILLRAATHPQGRQSPVHLQCTQACFARDQRFSQQVFGPGAWFENAVFSGDVWLNNATFPGNAGFESATFSGDVWLTSATFSGDAWFTSATFSGDAWFEGATFSGDVWFTSATFSGDARFGGATFSGTAWFRSATFSGSSSFMSATFSGNAWFTHAIFAGNARFMGATVSGNAWFNFVTFHKDAWFTATGEDAERAVFGRLATFDSAVFKAPARFSEAQFSGPMKFDKALFEAIADFSRVGLPGKESDWRAGFDGVLFQRVLDLRGVDPKGVSLVSGATLDKGILLDRTNEAAEGKAHEAALELAWESEDREDALKALESGALKLKQAMNTANDIAREQRFYRLELRARRKQKGTRASERTVSGLYALASGYGASLGRPVFALLSVVMAFTLWFWAWEGGAISGGPAKWPGQAASVDSNFVDAARYSLSRTFPFGPWAINDDRLTSEAECGFASRLQALDVAPSAVSAVPGVAPDMIRCRPRGGLEANQLANHRLLVGIAGTIESLLSLPLYFLLGLAIRRKFQIS